MYFLFFVIRRIGLVFLIVYGGGMPHYGKVGIFCLINFPVLAYLIIFRPFDSIKDNFLDIFNETVLTVFTIFVFFLNDLDKWTLGMSSFVLGFLTVMGFVL
jgi:hypothetical protein